MNPSGMRIAVVIPRFSERGTIGGAETLLRRHAERLVAAGAHVEIFTTCATDHVAWENVLPAGSRTIGSMPVHFFPVDARDAALWHQLSAQLAAGRSLQARDAALWLRHGWNSTALCRALASRGKMFDAVMAGPYLFSLVIEAAALFPDRTLLVPCLHDEPFAALPMMRGMFERVGALVFNTETERDLAQRLYGLAPGRGVVVGMGIHAFDTDASAFARRTGIETPYVIYSGRREEGKGTPLLLDYLALFRARTERDVKLVFTGSGAVPVPPELAPHVVDLGFVSESEKFEAMAGATVFVHPSVLESLGIVLLESWMACTPVLVHARSPVLRRQCARANGGLWFADYREFEMELCLLLDHATLRERLGRNGREFVLRAYAWSAVDQRLFQALARVVNPSVPVDGELADAMTDGSRLENPGR